MVLLDRKDEKTVLLLDACVLIDYRNSDMAVLKLVAEHMGDVVVLSHVLKEVDGLSQRELESHKVEIFEVGDDLMIEAKKVESKVIDVDSLCMVACRRHGWTCITNDRGLQRLCELHDVQARFGLGLMLDLISTGAMTKQHAKEAARLMQESNPRYIHDEIIREFDAKVDDISIG